MFPFFTYENIYIFVKEQTIIFFMSETKRLPELRVTNMPVQLNEELNNIKDNLGISLSAFLKPHLRKIVDSYDEHMKKPKQND